MNAIEAPVTVLVADDHPMFRAGTVRAIDESPTLTLVAETGDGRRALQLIVDLAPHVAVLDVRMPSMTGEQILETVSTTASHTKVLFLSAFTEEAAVHAALTSGARGYLSKDSTDEQICAAIHRVARGDVVVSPQLQAGVLGATRQRPHLAAVLSDRERQVLTMVAAGTSNAQIGAELHISAATVKTYLSRIFTKLEVNDRASATATALRQGLID